MAEENDTQKPNNEAVVPAAACYAPWKPPFRYERFGTQIVDSRDNRIVDVRGWGYLTGFGFAEHGMSEDQAEKIQDRIGEQVAAALNASCGHNKEAHQPSQSEA